MMVLHRVWRLEVPALSSSASILSRTVSLNSGVARCRNSPTSCSRSWAGFIGDLAGESCPRSFTSSEECPQSVQAIAVAALDGLDRDALHRGDFAEFHVAVQSQDDRLALFVGQLG